MKAPITLAIVLLFSTTALCFVEDQGPQELSKYNIDTKAITISGVSSGAYMAVQMEISFSKQFSGVGSIAGGIFWCAKGNAQMAQTACMGHPEAIKPEEQLAEVRRLEAAGLVDSLENVKSHKIYIYGSSKDSVINWKNSDRLFDFYSSLTNPASIQYENKVLSAHGFPTLDSGGPCNIGSLPWILKCNFDGAGEILQKMYGDLKDRGVAVEKNIHPFSQKPFGDEKTPLSPNGWVYVPTACEAREKCRLHVALHGCQMNPDFIQDKFVKLSGYNDWAETNHIIILYPQSAKGGQENPYACWDWFGFTGNDYANKNGPQMRALMSMVEKIQGLR